MKKRIFSRVLALVMALSLLSTTAFAAQVLNQDNLGTFTDATTGALLAHDGNGSVATSESENSYYDYYLGSDVELEKTLVINKGVNASLDLNGHNLMLNDTVTPTYNADGYLTNLTVSDKDGTKTGSVINIASGGELTLKDSEGSGKVTGGSAKFGSGVFNYGIFKMESGAVTGNRAEYGGGVCNYGSNSYFEMTGGSIKGNQATGHGGGIYGSNILLDGGSIEGNSGRGVNAGENFVMKSGSIRKNNGGGVWVTGSFDMSGGKISENYTGGMGGGVYASNSAQFNMSGGEINGNKAGQGGGVMAHQATAKFTMTGGTIAGNTSRIEGSGVQVLNGNFEMTGGSISAESGETVLVKTNYGNTSTMTKTNGTISGDVIFYTDKNSAGTNILSIGDKTYTLSAEKAEKEGEQIVTIVVRDADGKQIGESATTSPLPTGTKFKLDTTDPVNPRMELLEETIDKDITETFGLGGYVDNTGYHPYKDDDGNDTGDAGDTGGTGDTDDGTGTTIPDTDAPLGDLPTDADTTIEDEEVPLAGIVTLADLLNALWEYEGIEEIELPEDFEWIDHEYAQAIYWGLEEALVVDTEEDPLDPDELLTVALMREVLEKFAELYKGLEDFEVVLEGEDEDLIMDYVDMIARLAEFYEDLEAALAEQAA